MHDNFYRSHAAVGPFIGRQPCPELFPWGGEVGGFILKDQKQFNCYPTFNRFRTIDDRK